MAAELPLAKGAKEPEKSSGKRANDECDAENYDLYCAQVLTHKYGGNMEVRALSNALRVPIQVVEADGLLEQRRFVPEGGTSAPVVVLSFHRHLYNAPHFNLMVSVPPPA